MHDRKVGLGLNKLLFLVSVVWCVVVISGVCGVVCCCYFWCLWCGVLLLFLVSVVWCVVVISGVCGVVCCCYFWCLWCGVLLLFLVSVVWCVVVISFPFYTGSRIERF